MWVLVDILWAGGERMGGLQSAPCEETGIERFRIALVWSTESNVHLKVYLNSYKKRRLV